MSEAFTGKISTELSQAEKGAFAARRELTTLADSLQAEFEGTVAEVSEASDQMQSAAQATHQAIDKVREHTEALGSSATNATQNVDAVAAATEEMNVSINVVGTQISKAAEQAHGAVDQANRAMETIRTLSAASERIGDVVKLIEGIAGQTNLLALNATIEAARAGDAGKGFAVVASEVKILASQTANATKEISNQISEVQSVTKEVVDAISNITTVITQVEEYSSEVVHTVQEQTQAVEEIGRNAQQAAAGTRTVTDAVVNVVQEISNIGDMSSQQENTASLVHTKVETLQQRLGIAIEESQNASEARVTHIPFELFVSVSAGKDSYDGKAINMTATNCTLIIENFTPTIGQSLALNIFPAGRIDANVIELGDNSVGVKFAENSRSIVSQFMSSSIAMDQPIIHYCNQIAAKISKRFEEAIDNNEISAEVLFDTDYQAVSGSNPLQHEVQYLSFSDKILPPFQEPAVDFHEKIGFCAAVDINGYLPTHNLIYNKPQRSDDPVWNAGNCRNRRIFSDRTGKAAGANLQPYLLQSYLRDMGGGNFVLMKDLSCPIVINGRNWGNLRIGYKP